MRDGGLEPKTESSAGGPGRRAHVRTYGCQMNAHDSEKLANLLLHHGYSPAPSPEDADLLLINTCSIRDKAEHQLYSDLGALREWREARPGRILAVGGCVAQQAGDAILRRFPQVDFVFGTHNLRLVPALAEAASEGRRTARREISRPAAAILAEAESLVARGVREITLLGQTVNAYGRHDRRLGREETAGTLPFAELLARLADLPGLARLRYTSPHPIFFDAALARAHASLPSLCPHVHLPLQSGSDAVLERMRRRYTRDDYRRVVDGLREARPDLALTTDVIVGFPGETDRDFRETFELVREIGFVDAYLFRYSPRPGTAAATLPEALPTPVAQARLEELQELMRELTWAAHRERVGALTTVLVAGPSRRGGTQMSGRDPYHRVVNFESDGNSPAPGSLVSVRILAATPHSLLGRVEDAGAPPPRERAVKARAPRADELIEIQATRP